jgi:HK97 family phage prohead protease
MELERRILSHKVEIRSEGEGEEMEQMPMTISGYAAMFNQPADMGWYEEVINERAFEGCDMTDVAALFNHDMNMLLSRTNGSAETGLNLTIDEVGLKYEFKALNECAEKVAEDIKLGYVSKSSFGFYVENAVWEELVDADGRTYDRRTIMKISKLQYVSPVTFPAYGSTSVEARNFEHERPKKQIETTQEYILKLKLNRNENK